MSSINVGLDGTRGLGVVGVGAGARAAALPAGRLARRGRLLALILIAAAVGAGALAIHGSSVRAGGQGRAGAGGVAGARHDQPAADLLSLPAAAQAPVSAALGHDQAAYRINGLTARNLSQRLSARFSALGVAITAGSARFTLALEAFGRGSTLRGLASVSPVATANRVTYARGPVRESWANGPLGLEQGFAIARRPVGSGALTLSLAVSGSVRLDHGAVLLPGGLRYAGVRASDARGRSLRAWLQVRSGRMLVRVADRGAQYPVRIDPFVQQAELTPSDGVGCDGDCGDRFGYSVATSGNTVVVGAPYHEANSQPLSGAVYVFQMPAAGWASATQTAELTDVGLGGKVELGFSVAISSDGDTIVAGAPAGSEVPGNGVNTQGTVDVFSSTTGNWVSTSTPAARLTVSTPESPLGGELGWSVAIDGSTIVAGAPYDATAYPFTGVAYVFNEPAGGWSGPQSQAAVLTGSPLSSTGTGEDQFGWSVGISGDTIVVGAPFYAGASTQDQGAAYVFTGPWSGTDTQTALLLAGDPAPGNDEFGYSVAVSDDTVVVGAPDQTVGSNAQQGAAYVFVMPTAGPWVSTTQTAELTAADGGAGDGLGYSVAISGNAIVAGAPARQIGSNDGQGAEYVWTQPSGGWETTSADTAELTASDGFTEDNLGDSVAISGTTIVAGAPRHDAESATADTGAAYVFGAPAIGPPTAAITTPSSGASYPFGTVPDSSFTCSEAAAGPGISSCTATIDGGVSFPSGAPLLGTVGPHTITVTARSQDGQSATATAEYTVTPAATSLTAAPQLVLIPPPAGAGIGRLSATLTSGGNPVAGQTVSFTAGKTQLCSTMTTSSGTATCKLGLAKELAVLFADSYTASFAANVDYLASSASTPAIVRRSGAATRARNDTPGATFTQWTLSRGGTKYAIVSAHTHGGARHPRLKRVRRIRAGRYTLTVTLAGRAHHTIRRRITLG